MYFGARFYYGTKPVAPEDMDFKSDLAEIAADSYDEPPPKNKLEAFWQWLVSKAVPLGSVFVITNVILPIGVIIPIAYHQLYHLLFVSLQLPFDIPGCLL
jgi:hypothetical protein